MTQPTLHMIKLSVGTESIEGLARWQDYRRAETGSDYNRHLTRNFPRRAEELLAGGGSMYWVIKGVILARQRIHGFEPRENQEGERRCAIVLEPELIPTAPRDAPPVPGLALSQARGRPARPRRHQHRRTAAGVGGGVAGSGVVVSSAGRCQAVASCNNNPRPKLALGPMPETILQSGQSMVSSQAWTPDHVRGGYSGLIRAVCRYPWLYCRCPGRLALAQKRRDPLPCLRFAAAGAPGLRPRLAGSPRGLRVGASRTSVLGGRQGVRGAQQARRPRRGPAFACRVARVARQLVGDAQAEGLLATASDAPGERPWPGPRPGRSGRRRRAGSGWG